ncbi:MAG: hypothetical protein ACFFEA_11015, partial [Candidatus Thorarchaeota archaeon]
KMYSWDMYSAAPSKPTYLYIAEMQMRIIHMEMDFMGKGMALLGLILIIVGLLPIIFELAGGLLPEISAFFYMLGLFELDLAGFIFSEIMLILLVLGVLLLIIGAVR